jgi:hypothetical protein
VPYVLPGISGSKINCCAAFSHSVLLLPGHHSLYIEEKKYESLRSINIIQNVIEIVEEQNRGEKFCCGHIISVIIVTI